MAMDFWAAQDRQRWLTVFYLFLFTMLTLAVALLIVVVVSEADPNMADSAPYVGLGFLAITFLVAGYNYLMTLSLGGGYVARAHGGVLLERGQGGFKEQQLFNIVEELSLAASLPMPEIYILNDVKMINAFAAGIRQGQAAIAVTRGSLDKLTREELQGVIAHEMGHIANRDMRLSLRVAAMVTGFFVALYIGLRLIQGSVYARRDRNKQNPLPLIGMAFIVAGAVAWLAGSILQCTISRRREYLADASAVQYTRQVDGIAGALKKIEMETLSDMPSTAGAYAHLYFINRGFFSQIFATHPPLKDRIKALLG